MMMRWITTAAAPLMLGACALAPPPSKVAAPIPESWQAPLAHNGSVDGLSRWWAGHGDTLLAELVESGQAASPTIAAAGARIASARAQRTTAAA